MASRRLSVKRKASFSLGEDAQPTKTPRTDSGTEEEDEKEQKHTAAADAPTKDEAGAKASADATAPGNTAADPEALSERLQWEVQRLLAPRDLEQTTLGQMRSALEERMGMDHGALSSQKTLRRQFSKVLQDEVAKKQQRSHDCNLVMQAVVQLDGYPLRQMLIQSLPNALVAPPPLQGADLDSSSRALHAHQLRFLGIVRDAVAEARSAITAVEDARDAQVELVAAKRPSLVEACAVAAAARADAEASADSAASQARNLQDELSAAHIQVSRTEDACQNAGEEAVSLRNRCDVAAAMRDTQLRALLEGDWKSEDGLRATLAPVVSYLKEEECEAPLLFAAEAALQLRPEARGDFDRLALHSLGEFLAERMEQATKRLDTGVELMAEAEHLAAKAMLGAVQERVEAQELEWHKAQTFADEKARLLAGAEAELALLDASVKPLMVKVKSVQELAEDLDTALVVLDRQMSSGNKACSGPAAADNDASDDAHVIVATSARDGSVPPDAHIVVAEARDSHGEADASAEQPPVLEERQKIHGTNASLETHSKSEM